MLDNIGSKPPSEHIILQQHHQLPSPIECKMLVKYDTAAAKFTIHDTTNALLGSVSIIQFIKYVTSSVSKNFLRAYDYESAAYTIEKYFCRLDKATNKITLLSYLDSPVMGCSDVVKKLYLGIANFEATTLPSELAAVTAIDAAEAEAIQHKIKEFIYLILNYSLKLIVNIQDAIKGDPTKNEVRFDLTKYSIFAISKISSHIKEAFDIKVYECKNLEVQMAQLMRISIDTKKQLSTMEKTVKLQNEKINKILDYMDINDYDAVLERPDDATPVATPIGGVNKDFNESDFEYAETGGNKKGNIEYLTPPADD